MAKRLDKAGADVPVLCARLKAEIMRPKIERTDLAGSWLCAGCLAFVSTNLNVD